MSLRDSKKNIKELKMDNNNELNGNEISKNNKNIKDGKNTIIHQKNIHQDLLYFKNDILKDFREIQKKLNEELTFQKDQQAYKLNLYEKKIEQQTEKINYLSNLITESMKKTKVEELLETFSTKTEQDFSKVDYKINSIQKEIREGLYKHEKFFNETVLYPGIIGYECRFSNFHSFVDYVLSNIHQLKVYQELLKSYELHKIKGKIDKDLNVFQLQLKNNFKTLSEFATEKVNQSVKKFKDLLDDYNSKFVDIRVENNNSAKELKNHIDDVANSFGQIIQIKNEINERYDEQDKKIETLKEDINNNENKINEQNNEINNFDKKIDLLTTYIDKNFQLCLNNLNNNNIIELSRNHRIINGRRIHSAKEYMEGVFKGNISDNIDDKNKKNKKYKKNILKAESFVKRYIKGKIGIGEMYKHPIYYEIEHPIIKLYKGPLSEGKIIDTNNNNNNQFFNLTTVKTIKTPKNHNKNKNNEESIKINSNSNISLSRNNIKDIYKINEYNNYKNYQSEKRTNQSGKNKNKSYEIKKHNNLSFTKSDTIKNLDKVESLNLDKFKNANKDSYNNKKSIKMINNWSQTQRPRQLKIDSITRIPDIGINRITLPDNKTKRKLIITKSLSDGNYDYTKQNNIFFNIFEEKNQRTKRKIKYNNFNNYKSPSNYSSSRKTFNNKYIRQQLAKEKIPHFLLKKPKKQLLIVQ